MPSSSHKKSRGKSISSASKSEAGTPRISARLSGQSPDCDRLACIASMTPVVEHKTKKRLPNSGKEPKKISRFCFLPDVMLNYIFSYFVGSQGIDIDSYLSILAINRTCRDLVKAPSLWRDVSLTRPDNSLNDNALQYVEVKCRGTEGTCIHAIQRSNGVHIALKRARVYPDNEGVPYYMMREISTLKKLSHPNICNLEGVTLKNFKLYLIFPYFEKTLHDFLNPPMQPDTPSSLPKKHQTLGIMHQLCSAVAYLHRKGILHRNLKPKHLLVQPGPVPGDPLEGAQIILTDFALVRTLNTPPKPLTGEVITLWYRPPEILMGQRDYTAAVDVWSLGCIFAELLQGKALFEGLCEIDQLFQIFQAMGTPSDQVWKDFTALPNYQPVIFPKWEHKRLRGMVSFASDIEFDLLSHCLVYDPSLRMSAEKLLQRPYFTLTGTEDDSSLAATLAHIQSEANAMDASRKAIVAEATRIRQEAGLVNLNDTILPQHSFLKSLEPTMVASVSALHVQNKIFTNDDMLRRSELVAAILRVSGPGSSALSHRTSYFAIALADAYFVTAEKSSAIISGYAEWAMVVGACCMHIASKCEDVSYIGIRDIAFFLNIEYDLSHFLEIEESVLTVLGFDIYIPTVIDFLGMYSHCVPEISDLSAQRSLCLYLGHLSLYHGTCFKYAPSLVAAAIVSYALMYADNGTRRHANLQWPNSLKLFSGLLEEDVLPCVQELCEYQRNAALAPSTSTVTGLYQGYAVSAYHGVSLWHWLM